MLNLVLAFGCTNGKYDPNKSDRVLAATTQVTTDPTVSQTVGLFGGALGTQVLALINTGLILVHEFNAKKRASNAATAVAALPGATPLKV